MLYFATFRGGDFFCFKLNHKRAEKPNFEFVGDELSTNFDIVNNHSVYKFYCVKSWHLPIFP